MRQLKVVLFVFFFPRALGRPEDRLGPALLEPRVGEAHIGDDAEEGPVVDCDREVDQRSSDVVPGSLRPRERDLILQDAPAFRRKVHPEVLVAVSLPG